MWNLKTSGHSCVMLYNLQVLADSDNI